MPEFSGESEQEATGPQSENLQEFLRELREERRAQDRERENARIFVEHLRGFQHGQLVRFLPLEARQLLKIRADIVRDPAYAAEMCARHNRALVAHAIAAAIKQSREGDETSLSNVRETVKHTGGFLNRYTAKTLAQHIASAHWIIAQARGKHFIDPVQQTVGETATRADIHIRVPKVHARQPVLTPFTRTKGAWFYGHGENFAKEVKRHPEACGVVEDIVSDSEVMHHGYASAARVRAFAHLLEHHCHVRYVIAEVFSVTHLDEKPVDPEVSNIISLLVHADSKICPAPLVWRRVGRPLHTPSGKLGVAWDVTVHDIQRHRDAILDTASQLATDRDCVLPPEESEEDREGKES